MPVSVVQAFAHAQKVKLGEDGVVREKSTLSPEERAAFLIGRKYRTRVQNRRALDRARLIERLRLEKSVKTGIARMIFFLCVFFFNLLLTQVDVTPLFKLQLRDNIRTTLNLDAFDAIQTLGELRDFIPTVGMNIKTYAVSRNERYLDPFSMRLLNERTTFTGPLSLFTPFRIDGAEFTLVAWVEVLPGIDPSSVNRIPILRKAMQTDTALTCWGWFHAPEFRFGAHDFHSLDPTEKEASVSAELPLKSGLTHEVLVSKGGIFTFYRNGEKVVSIPTPRAVTDCDGDVVLLGSTSIALSSVSFYARAFQYNEVAEMYTGGQPLSELATGSVLSQSSVDSTAQVMAKVDSSAETIEDSMDKAKDQTIYNTVLSLSASSLPIEEDEVLHPIDNAGATVLPNARMGIDLPKWGQTLWENGGFQTAVDEEIRKKQRTWKNDSKVSRKPYYIIVQGPIFNENPSPMNLIHDFPFEVPNNSPGVTFNFWFQPLMINQSDCVNFMFYGGKCNVSGCDKPFAVHDSHLKRAPATQRRNFFDTNCPDDCLFVNYQGCSWWNSGAAGRINTGRTQVLEQAVYVSENGGVWDPEDPDKATLDEKFYASRMSAPSLSPLAWRMITLRLDMETRVMDFYYDAELVADSTKGGRDQPSRYSEIPSWFQLEHLSQGFVRIFGEDIRSFPDDPERVSALHRVADVRIYRDVLSPDEIRKLHQESHWPEGGKMRQCAQPQDKDYIDSMDSDAGKKDCLWYSKNVKSAPYICSSSESKLMCPVTCGGKRQCHDGSLYHLFQPPQPRPVYRIFNRVMRLKPRDTSSSLICQSNQTSRSDLLAKCRKAWDDYGCDSCAKGDNVFCSPTTGCKCSYGKVTDSPSIGCDSPKWSDSVYYDFYKQGHGDSSWTEFRRTDHWDCDEVDKNLGDCSWDSSWIPQFRQDVKATKFFSVTVWMKPTSTSWGMPKFFFPFLRIVGRREGRPITIVQMHDRDPRAEDFFGVKDAFFGSHLILNTALFNYRDWTRLYISWEKRDDGKWYKCITINAKALTCYEVTLQKSFPQQAEGPFDYLPEDLVESIEVHTEVLLAPIEFTSQKEPDSVLQQKFYKRKAELDKIKGPRTSESNRVEVFNSVTEKEVGGFDEKLGLVAPPLLFQTRLQAKTCNEAVADPFLKSQFGLVNSSHCTAAGMCPGVTGVDNIMQCVGSEASSETFFGLNTTVLNGEKGFADFLFTYSDNPIVVRQGQTLPTRNFFDSRTGTGKIVASFVSPENGVLTVVELTANFDGASISTASNFQMLSFLPETRKGEALWMAIGLFVALGFVLILSFAQIIAVIRNVHAGERYSTSDLLEVAYDVAQVVIIIVYGIMVIQITFNAEKRSGELVQDLVNVPFVAPDQTFVAKVNQFFTALDAVFQELQRKDNLSTFGFAIMILNLVKVLQTTQAHPRVGVLVATVIKGMDDIIHFAILFIIVFVTFAFTGTWAFGKERPEFVDLQAGMTTQFFMLNGDFPDGFQHDNKMIVYVVLTFVVQFLLMLNFMLAIVVDSYTKVKEDIELQETDSDIFSDYYWSTINGLTALFHKWPSDLAKKLETQLVVRAVTESTLVNALNISPKTAKSIVDTYFPNESIRYNREESHPLDKILLERATSTLGHNRTSNLLKSDKAEIQIKGLESDIANIAAKQDSFRQEVLELLKSAAAAKESPVTKTPLTSSLAHAPPARHLVLPASSSDSIFAPSTGPVQVFQAAPAYDSAVSNAEGIRNPLPAAEPPPHAPPTSPDQSRNNPSDGRNILSDLIFWQ